MFSDHKRIKFEFSKKKKKPMGGKKHTKYVKLTSK